MGARAPCAYIRVRARESQVLALRRTTPNRANTLRTVYQRRTEHTRATEKALTCSSLSP